MNKQMNKLIKLVFLLFILVLIKSNISYAEVSDIRLLVNQKDITDLSSPVIENGRMLVPIRFVSESLGAFVEWDGENRHVTIKKGDDHLNLKIDSQLIQYDEGQIFQLTDVAPMIINDRTYVPIRLVSNALGVGINWDEDNRVVSIESGQNSEIQSFYSVNITNIGNGELIKGQKVIRYNLPEEYKNENYKIKLLLLDPSTAEGYIKAIATTNTTELSYLPAFGDEGEKALVLGIYNASNDFIAGEVRRVLVDLAPNIDLKDIPNVDNIEEKVTFTPEVNFIPDHVNYEITNIDQKTTKKIKERDPFGSYTWYPKNSDNGNYYVKVIAVADGKTYESRQLPIKVNVSAKISLNGVKENQIINGPVNLIAKRNFDVKETIFYIKNLKTNVVEELKRIPYGSFTWLPNETMKGKKALKVTVEDTRGNMHSSDWVTVEIDHSPMIEILGVGPKQTVTKNMELNYRSNVNLSKVKYVIRNLDSSTTLEFPIVEMNESYLLPIDSLITGNYSLKVIGNYNGDSIKSDEVLFKIYKGKLYSAKPIIEKNKFLDFVSQMALNSYYKTDMSAALQTAQGILETGWGQSIPVDKYTGKFSNNLFGIKGTGSNGSVTSNTWEVYNGIVYRVDDYFRAYYTVNESWKDHKDLLLEASRYSIFRDVMYNSSLGAWAIRRAGYATDPQYPLKLMRIIEEYDLEVLDKIDL